MPKFNRGRIFAYLYQLADISASRTRGKFFRLLEQNKDIEIGCSFSLEHVEYLTHDTCFSVKKKLLDFIIDDLQIRNIRLGVRWNNSIDSGGKLDFSYYDPSLTYLLKKNVTLCLNIGPIKSFRWPESHLPKNITVAIPEKIDVENDVAKISLSYLSELLHYLKRQYPSLSFFQPENEAFFRFGSPKLIFSKNYIIHTMDMIQKIFPHASILLSSSENRNISDILSVFKLYSGKFPMHVGINYYYKTPPLFSSFRVFPDSITRDIYRKQMFEKLRQWSNKNTHNHIEISELQMEPWGKITSPGSSVQEFQYSLVRVCKNILPREKKSIIRIWGIERFALHFLDKKDNSSHRAIKDIILGINCI